MDKKSSIPGQLRDSVQKILVGEDAPPEDSESGKVWAQQCLLLARGLRTDESISSDENQNLIPVGKSSRPGIWYMHLKDLQNNVDVRIRQVRTEGKDLERGILNFLVRAQNLLRLDHPAFARTYAIIRHDPWISVIGEYIHGMPLNELVRELEIADIRTVVESGIYLALALRSAARIQAHHLNLTPANIIVDREGHLRLMDPSLKRLYSAAPALWKQETSEKPGWIPPEVQEKPDRGDARSDIFLLGKLLAYLKENLLEKDREPEEKLDHLSTIITRATNENPNERFLSHTYLIRNLEELLEEETPSWSDDNPLFEFPTPNED